MIGVAADRTVPALLARGTAALEAAGIESARPEAEWLLAAPRTPGIHTFDEVIDSMIAATAAATGAAAAGAAN